MDKEVNFDPTTGELVTLVKMKNNYQKHIFISHDSRDATIAESFCELLGHSCSYLVSTFCSSRAGDIFYGKDWFPVIMSELDKCTDVVCLFTKYSKRKPWLLFEAGYAKSKGINVRGLVIGIKMQGITSNHPFANFHNCDYTNEKGLIKLVSQLLGNVIDVEHEVNKKTIIKNVMKFIKDNSI